ncbi:MAG: CinA family protein [Anaerolineales bacterium]|nr:CinA family protein [Anaerolineales bacterium]
MSDLETAIGLVLRARHLTLAVAESCTGGLVGHRISRVAGASEYFLGGVIAYAYSAKENLLGVPAATLTRYGAVSAETAQAMARGVRRALGADVGVSVTGIAGPGGAQPGKPVGLTWIGLSAAATEAAQRFVWAGGRVANQEHSAEAALRLLHDYLTAGAPQG